MTDPEEFDSLEAAIEDYRQNRPRRDIVPTKGLDRDAIIALNDAVGATIASTDPGAVILDPDGLPIGVTESRTVEASMASPIIARAELEAAGLTEEEVPNVRVI